MFFDEYDIKAVQFIVVLILVVCIVPVLFTEMTLPADARCRDINLTKDGPFYITFYSEKGCNGMGQAYFENATVCPAKVDLPCYEFDRWTARELGCVGK